MRVLLFLGLTLMSACSCRGGHSFVLVIPGDAEPESAWITIGTTEYPMICSYIESFEEVHCDAPLETDDTPIEDVTPIGFVDNGERIDVSLDSAEYEGGGECNRGGWYFFRYTADGA